MFQPVSRVTEDEIRRRCAANGIWCRVDTQYPHLRILERFLGVFQNGKSLQAFHMCSARAVDTWVQCHRLFESKKDDKGDFDKS